MSRFQTKCGECNGTGIINVICVSTDSCTVEDCDECGGFGNGAEIHTDTIEDCPMPHAGDHECNLEIEEGGLEGAMCYVTCGFCHYRSMGDVTYNASEVVSAHNSLCRRAAAGGSE